MGPDTNSRPLVSELNGIAGQPAGVGQLVGREKTGTSGVGSVVSVAALREYRKRQRVFLWQIPALRHI